MFEATATSRQLLCFQAFFLGEFGALTREAQAARYDSWLGRPTPEQEAAMQAAWREVKGMTTWAQFELWCSAHGSSAAAQTSQATPHGKQRMEKDSAMDGEEVKESENAIMERAKRLERCVEISAARGYHGLHTNPPSHGGKGHGGKSGGGFRPHHRR